MKILSILFLLSTPSFAVDKLTCTPSKNTRASIQINFHKSIDPLKPFIGLPYFSATIKVGQYQNQNLKVTPEIDYKHLDLRGDAEGVYLKLYPQFSDQEIFSHYQGQLFVNDLNNRAYFNFVDSEYGPGFICD